MLGLTIPVEWQPWVAMAILGGMFLLFVLERTPVEVTAIGGAALMMVLGILPVQEATGVLANPAPWTIAMMFLVMGGLVRTGAVEAVIRAIGRHAGDRPRTVVVVLIGSMGLASAFMNNTPLVAVMIPVVIQLSVQIGAAPSKLLIPLSYMTVLGGMITLIGTSTNLLVDGVAADNGLEHFGLFEIAPLGIAVMLTGGAFLMLFGDRLLPVRQSMGVLLNDKRKMKFFTEVAVPEDSALIGQQVMGVDIFKREGVRVIDVLRGDASLRRDLPPVVLQAGDRVVLRTEMTELMGLHARKDVHLVEKLSSVKTETVEVLIGPGCRMEGQRLGDLRIRRRYGVYPLAVHRRNQNIGRQLDEVVVRVGDTLLLEGAPDDIRRLAADVNLVDLTETTDKRYRREHAPLVLAVLAGIVIVSSFDLVPIQILAMLGVVVLLASRTIEPEDAWNSVSASLIVLILAMLVVGDALDRSGAAKLIVDAISPWLATMSPLAVLFVLYFLTQILTEILSNNAVAVIVTPLAITLAHSLGLDPRPLVVAVMFAATLAFATPIGYQTNTMVYGPGGYKFTDFTRIGVPLNIVTGITTCLLIPLIWPLTPG